MQQHSILKKVNNAPKYRKFQYKKAVSFRIDDSPLINLESSKNVDTSSYKNSPDMQSDYKIKKKKHNFFANVMNTNFSSYDYSKNKNKIPPNKDKIQETPDINKNKNTLNKIKFQKFSNNSSITNQKLKCNYLNSNYNSKEISKNVSAKNKIKAKSKILSETKSNNHTSKITNNGNQMTLSDSCLIINKYSNDTNKIKYDFKNQIHNSSISELQNKKSQNLKIPLKKKLSSNQNNFLLIEVKNVYNSYLPSIYDLMAWSKRKRNPKINKSNSKNCNFFHSLISNSYSKQIFREPKDKIDILNLNNPIK